MNLFIKCKLYFVFKIMYFYNCCYRNLYNILNFEMIKYYIKNWENEFLINIDVS